MDELETIDTEAVQAIVDAQHCETNARIRDAITAGMAAFDVEFAKPCTVDGGSEDPGASEDPA